MKSEEIRATSLETLRQMVAMGLGVTLIPALASVSPSGQQVVLKPLAKPGAARTVGLVWRRRSPLAYTMAQLAETLAKRLPPGTQAIA
jgi:LysR family hydrogen peroxide-inducible transcriptional activator